MTEEKEKPVIDNPDKEKKPETKQPDLNFSESRRINLNIFLGTFNKDDFKKGGKFSGFSSKQGAAMEGDDNESDDALNINIYS